MVVWKRGSSMMEGINREVIVDSLTKLGRNTLQIKRLDITLRARKTWVSWGERPRDEYTRVLPLANRTLFLSARDWATRHPTTSLLPSDFGTSRASTSTLRCAYDGSYHYSTYDERTWQCGIYHALLPQLFIPTEMTVGEKTRPVTLKKYGGKRIALTWLFQESLDVRLRFQRVNENDFWKRVVEFEGSSLHVEKRRGPLDLSDLLTQGLSHLPKDPEFWKKMVDLARTLTP